MSIKDLFNKGYSLKSLKSKNQENFKEDLESKRYIDAYSVKRQKFLPSTDFSTASNFARFGLAEEYYENAIDRIYKTYPYDGSLAEKTEWENESNYLDLFIFENEYPRSNGFVTFNSSSHSTISTVINNVYSSSIPQYIKFFGGPNVDPLGDFKSDLSAGPSKKGVSKANIYDVDSGRNNNLEIDLATGNTIEFWMKKDGWVSTSAVRKEIIFHNMASGSALDDYGSLEISAQGFTPKLRGNIVINIFSGSTNINNSFSTGLTNIADGKWHHYAFTAKTSSDKTILNFYFDGKHIDKVINSNSINLVVGKMKGAIGSLAGPLSGSTTGVYANEGWGNITSASFDEFRYWKTERNAQQIGRSWRSQVAGGTNTDNVKYDKEQHKIDLGVYFKFNEGVVGNNLSDSNVLDYSGRISNGQFINYTSDCRNTGSAMVISKTAAFEFKDPILNPAHPDIISLLSAKKDKGRMHDYENNVSLYKSLPGWILEEDEKKSNNLKYLTQILASFFDDLYLQIENLPKLKDVNYPDDSLYEKPLPFAGRLLQTRGYDAPQLFANASALAEYLQRGENKLFQKKLYEIKNTIYQNIYNNLSYIQKSKGTFKSLRNFLRCFGVDEELIKLNIYANNDVYELKDNFTHTGLKKRYLDFDDADTKFSANGNYSNCFSANAYQYKNPYQDNSISYIPGIPTASVTGAALTIQAEIILPKRTPGTDINYEIFPGLKASIFGLNAVNPSDTDFTCAVDNKINFNVVINKRSEDRRDGKFAIETKAGTDIIDDKESVQYIGLYDNQKWNIAFRLRPTNFPISSKVKDSIDGDEAYTYELYGNNYFSDYLQNEFNLSGKISLSEAAKFFTEPKRIFVGSNRTNFTGSVETYSDVKISSIRAWYSYLDNETMRAHGKNSNTFGVLHPLNSVNLLDEQGVLDTKIPQIKSLIFNWTMDNVTGSDGSGQFFIDDASSGSSDLYSFGVLSEVLEKNYSARGDFFTSKIGFREQAIDVDYTQTAKQKLPEIVNSDDMVKVLGKQDDVVFTRETTYIQHLLSVEKSMYQTISEEMIKFFASIADFNNLIGEPVNRYRPFYKKMEKMRDLFFMGVENEPDLDKFIEFYKWIDDAVTMMIMQLIPASANTVELLRNMVESHILERNKYWTKFPTIESQPHKPISSLKAIKELKYNWKFGHAPVGAEQNTNQDVSCLWWRERAERSGVLSSGVASVDADREKILQIAITEVSGASPKLKKVDGTKYISTDYYNKKLSNIIDLSTRREINLKVGSNPTDNKIHDYYKSVISWGSDDDFIYLDLDNKINERVCNDPVVPPELNKKKVRIETLTMLANETINSNAFGTDINDQQYNDAKSTLLLPFSMYSSSVSSDYKSLYSDQFGLDFTNLHDDKYGPQAEIPLQGPFTRQHVGGMAHRHIKLNQGSDNQLNRAEGWHLESFLNLASSERILEENFDNATTTPTTDTSILNLPAGSESPEPSPYEYWRNGVAADNSWTFFKGSTPSVGTGPAGGFGPAPNINSPYAFCEVLPAKVGQTFSLVTPLIDLLDLSTDSSVRFYFRYHMHGIGIGNLRVQASRYRNFSRGVQDLHVRWGSLGSTSSPSAGATVLAGQQHTSDTDNWSTAIISSESTYGEGLKQWLGKRFYIRFLYTAGPSHLGDCAIDSIDFYKSTAGTEVNQNSFKLFHPTYDDVKRPYATLTRDNLAKSPVNIKNIHMTGNSPTVAGNYLNRYEYVSTNSPEANDPFFVKNISQINAIHPEIPLMARIQDLLSTPPGLQRTSLAAFRNFTLPDRSFLTGSIKNKTRIMTRFSAPGGYEVTSRGFLDPAHETFSVYNATTFRNLSARSTHNTQLQAHSGKFGVSEHIAGTGAATFTITVSDGDALVTTIAPGESTLFEKQDIRITSADGETIRYIITDGSQTGARNTGATVTAGGSPGGTGDTGAGISNFAGVAVQVNIASSTETKNRLLRELRSAILSSNGHAGKILVSDVPTEANGPQSITLTQRDIGGHGNTAIQTNIGPFLSSFTTSSFSNPSTARVFGSETTGTINSLDYSLTGDASFHKYHRNNIERIELLGASQDFSDMLAVTASVFDNAFVSHMIPRTDQQTRWITASII